MNQQSEIEEQGSETGKLNPGNRRKLLRNLLAGGGVVAGSQVLPGNWTRPVVDSVILPAHAQTTVQIGDPCQVAIQCVSDSTFALSGFVTPATGGVEISGVVEAFDSNGTSLGTLSPANTFTNNAGLYSFASVNFGMVSVSEVEGRTMIVGTNKGDTCRVDTPNCVNTTPPPPPPPPTTTTCEPSDEGCGPTTTPQPEDT